MNLNIRPPKAEEIHLIVDYFYQCSSADLKRMGAAPEKLPPPKVGGEHPAPNGLTR